MLKQPTLRAASVLDGDRIRAFLTGLSPDALYQRFLTGMSRPSPKVVDYLAGAGAGKALVAEYDGVVVGHGLWAPVWDAPARPTAEIAVVVADDHRRRGIGTALIEGLVADLTRHGYQQVRIESLATNRAVRHMVARADPWALPERDGPVWTYELAARTAADRLPWPA